MRLRITLSALLLGLVVLWLLWPRTPDPPPPEQPNVVLVVACTLRADQTTLVDPSLETTPFLASLAEGGVWFADGIASAPWTRPAAGALLTGRHPGALGLSDPASGRSERRLPAEATTLAEHLRGAGYETLGVTTNPNLDPHYGFDAGFDAYASLSPLWDDGQVTKVDGREAVAEALGLLDDRSRAGAPFHLQVVLVDAHLPYDLGPRAARPFEAPGISPRVARYRAMVRALDGAIEALHAGLEARGHDERDTLFLVVSDHGEGLNHPPHHGPGHGRYLYPSTLEMVWLASGPRLPRGHAVEGLVSQVDVLPTLLGHLGHPAGEVDGLDHSAAWLELRPPERDHAFAQTRFRDVDRAAIYTPDQACLIGRDLERSLAVEERAGRPQFVEGCFDRRADPDFLHPFDDPDLEEALRDWVATVDVDAPEESAADDLDPDVRAHLETLGYLE